MSTDLAKYIADNKDDLYPYANEDASLGIWLDRSPINKAGELNYFNVGFGKVKGPLRDVKNGLKDWKWSENA